MIDGLLWFGSGLFTAYLMYGKEEQIPVFKTVLVTLFGIISLIVWCLFNLGAKIHNPIYKADAYDTSAPQYTNPNFTTLPKAKSRKRS